jgi:hypothetical protein
MGENEAMQYPSDLFATPDDLSDGEQELFKRIVYEMMLAGVDVREIDQPPIEALSRQLVLCRQEREAVEAGEAYTLAAEQWAVALQMAKDLLGLSEEALNRLLALPVASAKVRSAKAKAKAKRGK